MKYHFCRVYKTVLQSCSPILPHLHRCYHKREASHCRLSAGTFLAQCENQQSPVGNARNTTICVFNATVCCQLMAALKTDRRTGWQTDRHTHMHARTRMSRQKVVRTALSCRVFAWLYRVPLLWGKLNPSLFPSLSLTHAHTHIHALARFFSISLSSSLSVSASIKAHMLGAPQPSPCAPLKWSRCKKKEEEAINEHLQSWEEEQQKKKNYSSAMNTLAHKHTNSWKRHEDIYQRSAELKHSR